MRYLVRARPATDYERKYLAAKAEVERLTAEIERLRAAVLGQRRGEAAMSGLRLTKQQREFLRLLLSRSVVPYEAVQVAFYGGKVADGGGAVMRTVCSQVRKKIAPYGAVIGNIHGVGYRLVKRGTLDTVL